MTLYKNVSMFGNLAQTPNAGIHFGNNPVMLP